MIHCKSPRPITYSEKTPKTIQYPLKLPFASSTSKIPYSVWDPHIHTVLHPERFSKNPLLLENLQHPENSLFTSKPSQRTLQDHYPLISSTKTPESSSIHNPKRNNQYYETPYSINEPLKPVPLKVHIPPKTIQSKEPAKTL